MRKQFSNREILNYAEQLNKVFLQAKQDIDLPIRINFYLQKNIKTFMEAAQEIDKLRLKIGEKYGEFDSKTNSYTLKSQENVLKAQEDIDQLLSIDQILDIQMILLSDLEKETQLNVAQMNAMFFMIIDDISNYNEFIDEE